MDNSFEFNDKQPISFLYFVWISDNSEQYISLLFNVLIEEALCMFIITQYEMTVGKPCAQDVA